jgi:integrase/recombinase XerC
VAPAHPLIDAYLSHLTVERRVSSHTVAAYQRDLSQLFEAAASLHAGLGRPVDALNRRDLEDVVRQLMSEGRSPRSVARAVACFRGFYRFLVVGGRRPPHPPAP